MSMLLLNISGEAKVRGVVSSDGIQKFSVYDIITAAIETKDTKNSTSRKRFACLIKEGAKSRDEILSLCEYIKFPGIGQRHTPAMTADGLLLLLTKHLQGSISHALKEEMMDILHRYLDGDMSLCEEVDQNREMGKHKSLLKFSKKVMERAHVSALKEHNQMPKLAYVYGTKTEAEPNLIKIGRSGNMFARLSSMNTSIKTKPHKIVAVVPTFDSDRDEKWAHAFFSSKHAEGEFYEVTIEELRSFFMDHIMPRYEAELARYITLVQGA
jgi:hypothetical protein